MTTVNRSALVVRPRERYFEWASSVDEGAAETVNVLREAGWASVYLVDQDPHERRESAPLEGYFEEIFDRELNGWHRDPEAWPQVRTFDVFTDWFEVYATSVVTDLGAEMLLQDDD